MNGATSPNRDIESPATERTLVLCFDGTSEIYDDHNSNVVKLFSFLEKESPAQLVYYQTGIGTYGGPQFVTTVARWIEGKLDEAFAWTLDTHVKDGYKFLQENYEQGDRICLFGFSRGAYTARALAGMLFTVGLLPRSMVEEVDFAYSIFKNQTASADYKRDFSRSVRIEFIGVWDTVPSVGALFPRILPFSADNHITKTFRHALSLDEHRAAFQQNNWHRTVDDTPPGKNGTPHAGVMRTSLGMIWRLLTFWWKRKPLKVIPAMSGKPTHVKEVWFAGCHSDIGGGDTQNDAPNALSNIPLRWMIKEILEAHTGIIFREDPRLTDLGIVLHPPSLNSKPAGGAINKNGTEDSHITTPSLPTSIDERLELDDLPSPYLPQDVNHEDIVQPIQDALQSDPLWWILEFLPFVESFQDEHSKWHSYIRFNLFHGRRIPPPPSPDDPNSKDKPDDMRGVNLTTAAALFHVSVQERMNSTDTRTMTRSWKSAWLRKNVPYKPRAQFRGKYRLDKPKFVR